MSTSNVEMHKKEYWNIFYKENNYKTVDWYFELQNLSKNVFDLNSYNRDTEILVIGVGSSSITDILVKEKFSRCIFIDFCQGLIEHLADKYLSNDSLADWDCKLKIFLIFPDSWMLRHCRTFENHSSH